MVPDYWLNKPLIVPYKAVTVIMGVEVMYTVIRRMAAMCVRQVTT